MKDYYINWWNYKDTIGIEQYIGAAVNLYPRRLAVVFNS